MATKQFRWYTTLEKLKSSLSITTTIQDEPLSDKIQSASEYIELATNRIFLPVTATKSFDVPLEDPTHRLYLGEESLSVSSITDASGTIPPSSYMLYPLNYPRKTWVQLVGASSWSYSSTPYGAIAVSGTWGYNGDTEDTGATLSSNVLSGDTSLVVSGGAYVRTGDSLLIDNEQVFVSAISANIVTVVRGNNGTTAASHVAGVSVYRYVVPGAIANICNSLASFWYQNRDVAGLKAKQIADFRVEYQNGYAIPGFISDSLASLKRIM